ncbi:MAG: ACT domain-containing protein [Selenomonadaceae bacterium]|nr:ACT domain-containing protein [Selenomonadaceae bacterium]
MKIKPLKQKFSICKLKQIPPTSTSDFVFYARTDEEISMVCETDKVPRDLLEENSSDDWRAFRIAGTLDFSLTGILARISKILADNSIGIFAVSTFNTDYILVKEENFNRALDILVESDYEVEGRVKSHANVVPLVSKEERDFEDVTLEEINQRLEELERFISTPEFNDAISRVDPEEWMEFESEIEEEMARIEFLENQANRMLEGSDDDSD